MENKNNSEHLVDEGIISGVSDVINKVKCIPQNVGQAWNLGKLQGPIQNMLRNTYGIKTANSTQIGQILGAIRQKYPNENLDTIATQLTNKTLTANSIHSIIGPTVKQIFGIDKPISQGGGQTNIFQQQETKPEDKQKVETLSPAAQSSNIQKGSLEDQINNLTDQNEIDKLYNLIQEKRLKKKAMMKKIKKGYMKKDILDKI